jgi:hypothetical protein
VKLAVIGLIITIFMIVYIIFLVQGKNLLEIIYRSAVNFAPTDPLVATAIYSLIFIVVVGYLLIAKGFT